MQWYNVGTTKMEGDNMADPFDEYADQFTVTMDGFTTKPKRASRTWCFQ